MSHESDILPRSFKVQPWTKLRICFQKLICSEPIWFQGWIQYLFSLTEFRRLWSATSSKHCPLLSLKSPTSVEWSWPTAFDFLYRSGTTRHVWFNCLGCLWIHIWFAIPKGCESQWMCLYWTRLFDSCIGLPERVVCAKDWAGQKSVALLLLIPSRIESIWFSIDSYAESGCLKLFFLDSLSGGMKCYSFYLTSLLDSSKISPPGSNLMRNIFWL